MNISDNLWIIKCIVKSSQQMTAVSGTEKKLQKGGVDDVEKEEWEKDND
jgi:hypothetical protein